MKILKIAAFSMLAMITEQAHADPTGMEIVIMPEVGGEYSNTNNGVPLLITLSPFDTSLGTLDSWSITITGNLAGTRGYDGGGGGCSQNTAVVNAMLSIGGVISDQINFAPQTVVLGPTVPRNTLGSCNFIYGIDDFTASFTNLSPLLNINDPQIFVSGNATDGIGGDGEEDAYGNLHITLTYEYDIDPVDEPYGLFVIGLFGLGYVSRHRKFRRRSVSHHPR